MNPARRSRNQTSTTTEFPDAHQTMNRRERRIQRTEAGEERHPNHGFRPGAAYSPEGWTRMPEAGILTADERRWTRMGNHKDTKARISRIDTDSLAAKERKGTQRVLTREDRMNRSKQRERRTG